MDDYNEYLIDKKNNDILKKIISTHGENMQLAKTIEELNELSVVLSKFLGGDEQFDHMAEEIADVEIMLKQLKMMFNLRDDVKRWKKCKIQRLSDYLEGKYDK